MKSPLEIPSVLEQQEQELLTQLLIEQVDRARRGGKPSIEEIWCLEELNLLQQEIDQT